MLHIAEPTQQELDDIAFRKKDSHPVLIREELDFDIDQLKETIQDKKSKLTNSQRIVFEKVLEAVENNKPFSLFIDARGGTGKTYVLNTILAAVRVMEGGSVA